jgi:phosphoglycerate kinase
LLPIDVVTIDANDIKGGTTKNFSIKSPEEVSDNDVIVDAGPKTLELLKKIISGNVAQIIWNGPLGAYEQGFKQPTIDLASAIAESTRVHATNTIVGGADTLATIEEIKETTGKALETEFSFVSTGGGAMLDFLANETLPGIEALEKSSQ